MDLNRRPDPDPIEPTAKPPDAELLARARKLIDGKVEANLKTYKLVEAIPDYRGNSGHSKYIVTLEGPKGEKLTGIFHTGETVVSQERFRLEQAAYKINKAMGFDNGFPPTVEREFTIRGETKKGWLQIDAGEELETAARALSERTGRTSKYPDVARMLRSADEPNADPVVKKFKDQLEQAFIERLIYGDSDSHSMNFVVQNNFASGLRVRNIDLEFGFGSRTKPAWIAGPSAGVNEALQSYFSEARVSNATLEKITEFVKEYDTPEGRKKLVEFGLTTRSQSSDNWLGRLAEKFGIGKKQPQIDEVDALLKRAKWFIDPNGGDGRFPKLESARPDKMKPADLASFFKKGELPQGEYFVKDKNGERVKVFAGVETVKFEEEGFVDFPKGKPVTLDSFQTVMDAAFEQNNRPGRIRLLNDPKNSKYGQFWGYGKNSEVMVNEFQNRGLVYTYDHESGHFVDHLELLSKDNPGFKQQFNDAYSKCLFKSGNLLEKSVSGFKELNAKDTRDLQILDTDSFEVRLLKWKVRGEVESRLEPDNWYCEKGEEYFHCRSELLAEMHAYFREQTRAVNRSEPKPTYQQLVERVSGKSTKRAEAMKHYEDLYKMVEPCFEKVANERPVGKETKPKSDAPQSVTARNSTDETRIKDGKPEGKASGYRHITENDQAQASDDVTMLNLQKALTRRLLQQGWPKSLSEQISRQLEPDALREAVKGFDESSPCAVFIGQKEGGSVQGRDEVTNAATVLYFTPENGVVHVLDQVPRDALTARFKQGDTALFEQGYSLDQRSLSKKPTTYEVPRKEYEELLRKVGRGHVIEVTDPDTGMRFSTVIPGHEAIVGQLIVAQLKHLKAGYRMVCERKSDAK